MKNIKKTLTQFACVLTLGTLAVTGQAAVLFQDNFDSYSQGELPTNSGSVWAPHSGSLLIAVVPDPSGNSANALEVNQALTVDVHAFITNSSFPSLAATSTVSAVYSSYTINLSTLPASSAYFSHFYANSSTFAARVFTTNNGDGTYSVGIANGSAGATPVLPTELSLSTTYTVVTRYVPSSGISTLWLNPVNEASSGITATDAPNVINVVAYAFRQNTGEGVIDVDNLIIGTSFTNVVPSSAGSNPPFIGNQPVDNLVAVTGDNVSFTNVSGGDPVLRNQWYSIIGGVTNGILNATNPILSLTSVTTGSSGYYYSIVTNSFGSATTRLAQLNVYTSPVAVSITNQPVGEALNVGDTIGLSVGASGVPPPTYQWYWVTNSGATFKTNLLSGATAATYTNANITTNLAGKYYVIVTNRVGAVTSSVVVVTIAPPITNNISTLRAMVDPSTFLPTNTTTITVIKGYVTSWTNMTGSANTEFYMQDGTAGICVYWSGAAASTNLPPAGAYVQVSGAMANFSGLLELEAYFTNSLTGVKILSTNNPLPAPQPLPFDPNIAGNHATMEKLEGTYFVASNVTLAATATYVSGANEGITNNAYHIKTDTLAPLSYTNDVGQTFTIYWNAYTGIPGQAKPTGPVTVYGVLGNFNGLYEFTPTRIADIVTYVTTTNVLTNARKGDVPTNTYTELVLRPGETLATKVSIADPEGGTVTLSPVTGTLPGTASWSGISGGNATLNYTPATGDAGNNYPIQLAVSSTSGNSFTNTLNVYVPTADEQAVAITELLANPITNTNSKAWNPLLRTTDTLGVATNDEYVEIANQSPDAIGLTGWALYNGTTKVDDFNVNGPTLNSSNAIVVYGGNTTETPSLPVYGENASSGKLLLTTNGATLVLRNNSGYIVDRVVYTAANLSTNGSITRFPTLNSAFVPQAYISTNLVTAGLQYDGGSWGNATKVPTGVTGVTVIRTNGQSILHFTANTTQASTLWSAPSLTAPFSVITGQPFPSGTGAFTNTGAAGSQFFFITTQ